MQRNAFTLIELLVVVTIIAILGGMVLGVVAGAREAAREAATRATLLKIDSILSPIWEGLATRRIPAEYRLSDFAPMPIPGGILTPGEQLTKAKANARRDMVRMELPDRWSDVINPPLCLATPPGVIGPWPAMRAHYVNVLASARAGLVRRKLLPDEIDAKLTGWQSAECLYLIVMAHGGQDISWGKRERGDTDGDGLKEFLDGWGHPIAFLRWPVGYPGSCPAAAVSDPRGVIAAPGQTYPAARTVEEMGPRPLAYSAGPDGIFDVNKGLSPSPTDPGEFVTYEYRLDTYGNLDPWTFDDCGHWVGEPLDSTSINGDEPDGHLSHLDNLTSWNYDR